MSVKLLSLTLSVDSTKEINQHILWHKIVMCRDNAGLTIEFKNKHTHISLFFVCFCFSKTNKKQKQTKQTLIRYNGWTEKEWKSSGCPMNPLQKPGAQEHLKLRKTSRDAMWHQACRPYSNALDKVLTLFISGLRVSCMLQSPVHLTSV